MINVVAELRRHLVAQTVLTNQVGSRIYGGMTFPGPGYVKGQKAITFSPRGGTPDNQSALLTESFTFKCYAADEVAIFDVYAALVEALHDKRSGHIRSAQLEVTATPLQEQSPLDWWFALCYFRVMFNFNLGV